MDLLSHVLLYLPNSMPKKCPYLLTLDMRQHTYSLKKYHKELSIFLYKNVPIDFQYTFYVEIGYKGQPHAHGWFTVPDGKTTVLGCVLRKYKSRFGLFFHSVKKHKNGETIGKEYFQYCQKDQQALAVYWNTTTEDIKVTRETGKTLYKTQGRKKTVIGGIVAALSLLNTSKVKPIRGGGND